MKVEVDIPEGKYCGDCKLLDQGAGGYCNLNGEQLPFNVMHHQKHPDCPSLKDKR